MTPAENPPPNTPPPPVPPSPMNPPRPGETLREAIEALRDDDRSATGEPGPGINGWVYVQWLRETAVLALVDKSAAPVAGEGLPHQPGEPHEYGVTCKVCGQRGTVRLSIEPQYEGSVTLAAALAASQPVAEEEG